MEIKPAKSESRQHTIDCLYDCAGLFFRLFSNHRSSVSFKEVHLTERLRADVLNISYDDKVVILELKTCRQDYTSDNKWDKYSDYCDYFYFMCPEGVIKSEELSHDIGLIYVYNILKDPYLKIVKSPYKLKARNLTNSWFRWIYKKLAFRRFVKFSGKLVDLQNTYLFQ